MDVRHVCVLIMAIPPGVMEREMSFMMITTLTNMERIHGVIAIGRTENAITFLVKIIREFVGATVAGSVKVVVLVYSVAVHNVSCSVRILWMFDKALCKLFFFLFVYTTMLVLPRFIYI